ncbi:hypothetical protein H2248_012523 [Termitomyces sp. 'cryptogamus']|nr:hypothetical protein H2248_012523 [Termitomyces sp. 'cryptogamus']
MPGVVIGNSTRIWEVNVHWEVYSQCCMWDPRSRCVNIWECIKDHDSKPGTEPPNDTYWRYVARR